MSLIQNEAAKGFIAIPEAGSAGEVISKRFTHTFPNTIAAGDIVEMAPIPAGMRVVDMILDSDSLDSDGSSKTMDVDVGIMSGEWGINDGDRTCGAEFFDGDTTVRAGGTARPSLKTAFRTGVSSNHRSIGIKVATVAAEKAAGEVGLTVFYASE